MEQHKLHGSQQSNKDDNKNETKEESQGDGSQGNEEKSEESQSNNPKKEKSESDASYTMEPNNLLDDNSNVDWKKEKNMAETLYTTLTAVSLDLEKIGVSRRRYKFI